MEDGRDYWEKDDFEDTVAAALIACYETKFRKNKGAAPPDRLTEERIAVIRSEGPYLASDSREFLGTFEGKDNWTFDLINDRLPINGLHAYTTVGLTNAPKDSYLCADYIRQVNGLGKNWHQRKAGVLYEMFSMTARSDGIHGERRFFTVTKKGEVVSCDIKLASIRGYSAGERIETFSHDEKYLHETSVWASVALQLLADRRFCWTITAKESSAKATLACMMEEVKSLLYARSLPMTATGRKRPILHLVESHKRRMRNGIDVDVTAFLRGQQTVEIGGTVFKVNPPDTLRSDVSMPSRERYFADIV